MIERDRVLRMTRMSCYEEQYGAADARTTSYFRGDYLTRQILITLFCSTFAFIIFAAAYVIYHFETLIVGIYNMDLGALAMRVLGVYVVYLLIMTAVTIAVYMRRYSRARRHIAAYYHDLGELSSEYRAGKRDDT